MAIPRRQREDERNPGSQRCKEVAITDLSRDDMAEAIEDAFRYDKLVLAAASYDASVFPCMETFLNKLNQ